MTTGGILGIQRKKKRSPRWRYNVDINKQNELADRRA